MISQEFQDLTERSIYSKESMYDFIDKVMQQEKTNRHDLKNIVKDIGITSCYWR
ncbi:MAG: hypothetical protein N4A31_02990 [Rickettsiales bacterium]|jgi:hypothetical protein|nr:hypothetical protein [Rickettsiales bacterium]